MPLILGTNSIKDTGYDVANSCRFNSGDSPSLKDGDGSAPAGNRQKFTFSVWFKRAKLGVTQMFAASAYSSGDEGYLYISGGDVLVWHHSSSGMGQLVTTQKFKDVGAWYHLVWSVDTTQSTASNRMKFYINGTQITSFSTETYPDEDKELYWNVGGTYYPWIGRRHGGDYWDGYLAEIVHIDNAQLAADSFGKFNSDSPTIWQPIDVSGLTFGTAGYHLDFEDSSELGKDVSGQGNHFGTVANLAATDQSTDTPTNNFATMNPLVKANTALTFSEGNLKVTSGGGWGHAVGNIGVAHGKWYWEIDEINASNNAFFGICNENNLGHLTNDSTPYSEAGLMLWFYDGRRTIDGTDSEGEYSGWGTTHGFALDLDSDPRTIKFYKDNSLEATENLTANFSAGEFVFPIFMGSASSNPAIVEFNFGNPVTALASAANDANGYGSFEFEPPSGYIAICTKNLGSDGG